MKLTKKDYTKILNYYGKKPVYTKKNKYNLKKTKELTRQVLSKKLCDCIKKVQKSRKKKMAEKDAIAICRNSIFSNRGIGHYRFTCKKGPKLRAKKGTNHYLKKEGKITYL